ncbi:MAG: P1 family peptidase [Candidatus Tectomicrobia bacterium]|uniref:P1 family peptidase n=1 Tax=Tectimicrobiota bacterium TaxID=2528274 RepID=A0A932M190_UNCTE|nr:P1 family peptidase [Candidatus Tectomicrobia bacterium]
MDEIKAALISDVGPITIGHASDFTHYTGCTVILCEQGAVAGVEVRGLASSTRELDALSAHHLVDKIHALLLAGGSAFGLEAASGVMDYLEEKGIGFQTSTGPVPIVPCAILYDLNFASRQGRPNRAMGYEACLNAAAAPPQEGSIGAGTGATVGKLFGIKRATKGGLGVACYQIPDTSVLVGAMAAVNAFGDVLDRRTREILAGARSAPDSHRYVDTAREMMRGVTRTDFANTHTTLGVIVTNAALDKRGATILARLASNGLVRVSSPASTTFDGDVVFALSVGNLSADINVLGVVAAEALSEAVNRGVRTADGFGILPSHLEIAGQQGAEKK